MATSAFIVRGTGNESSLRSASHGAGRRMSRKQAKKRYRWADVTEMLRENKIRILSAGLDEIPMAYKDIHEVMAAQRDLVRPVAHFQPRLVKMAPGGEPPED
jgi:tRNA-splicing ligase RtcB